MSEHTNRKASGHWFAMGMAGELTEGQTLTCTHCQSAWVLCKGSGKMRGFCTKCMGYTCGAKACLECVPAERRLENAEAGRPELTPAPVKILMPDEITKIQGE